MTEINKKYTSKIKFLKVQGKIYLLSVGKAATSMTEGLLELCESEIEKGYMVIPYGYNFSHTKITVFNSGHPVPDENGEFAAKTILQFLENTDEKDTIILLLFGGESALLPLPRNGITLQDKTETTRQLLLCGARIQETNAVKKHLSMIKGGNLAYKIRGALIILILSDVLGDSLDSIASGPTVPDPTIYEDVSQILTKYNLWGKLPQNIERLIKRVLEDLEEETPKNIPKRHFVEITASNKTCVNAGINKAKAMSFNTMLLTTYLEGEAKEVTHALSSIVKEIKTQTIQLIYLGNYCWWRDNR